MEFEKMKKMVVWVSENNLVVLIFDFKRQTESIEKDVLLNAYKKLYPLKMSEKDICEEGCVFKEICIPYRERVLDKFCSVEGEIKIQSKTGSNCLEDYECVSELCFMGKCKNELLRIIYRFIRLFIKN